MASVETERSEGGRDEKNGETVTDGALPRRHHDLLLRDMEVCVVVDDRPKICGAVNEMATLILVDLRPGLHRVFASIALPEERPSGSLARRDRRSTTLETELFFFTQEER